jgi:hypothetical protein
MMIAGSEVGALIEAYARLWLKGTDVGRKILGESSLDEAIDAVFELLNAGFIKLEGDATGIKGIKLCAPPEPPLGIAVRPRHTPKATGSC